MVDELSALIHSNDTTAIHDRYESDVALRVSPTVMSLGPNGEWGPDEVAELV